MWRLSRQSQRKVVGKRHRTGPQGLKGLQMMTSSTAEWITFNLENPQVKCLAKVESVR